MREDCFYFITSVCARGESCAYRHNQAAKSTTVTCANWASGRECFDGCAFRHSNYQTREKKETPCYWETRGGCKKSDCPYTHWERKYFEPPQMRSTMGSDLQGFHHSDSSASQPAPKSIEEIEKEISDLNSMFRY